MASRKPNEMTIKEAFRDRGVKKYVRPKTASMEEFTSKTAVGVSPAMKKREGYIVSTLF
jgi:hypothetical protein